MFRLVKNQPLLILLGIAFGCLVGFLWPQSSASLKPFGTVFLNLLFMVVTPLVFFSLSAAVCNLTDLRRLGRILGTTALVFLGTGLIAGALIIAVVKIWPPALGVSIQLGAAEAVSPKTWGQLLVDSLTVSDFPLLFSRQHMLPLILFSILFGLVLSLTGGEKSPLGKAVNQGSLAMGKLVDLIMWYAPLGLFAYFASLVGEFGSQLVGGYVRALAIYYPTCVVYGALAFPFYCWLAKGRQGLKDMRHLLAPALTAFATGSSVATIPVNREACEKIGVPADVRELVLPLGATAHMDGSVLSGVLKISFLYGVFGLPFSGVGTLTTALLVAILSAFVLSGAPGGGLAGELLIVSIFGFPAEAFPLVATIGFLVDAPATALNATGDTVASMLVSRIIDGKDWAHKKDTL